MADSQQNILHYYSFTKMYFSLSDKAVNTIELSTVANIFHANFKCIDIKPKKAP